MSRILTTEVMALDGASVTFTDGRADDINQLTDFEMINSKFGTGLNVRDLFGSDAKFVQAIARLC